MAAEFYDETMSRQQEALAATPDMQAQRRAMLTALALKPGERALEIGAGNGIMVREMLVEVGPSGAVTGLDSAAPMVEMARALCPEGTFVEGDAAALPFADASFDVATAAQVFCFLPDPDRALAELHRVLAPGGRLVILDTDWGSLVWNCRDRELMDRAMALYTSPYADAHLPRTLSRRLARAGFRVTARDSLTVLNWDRAPDTYAGQTTGFLESLMTASDAFTEADWQAWDADQAAMAEAGEFMFSLNRYIFSAMRD